MYQANDVLEYIWKTHLLKIEEKYRHVFSPDVLRIPKLDMLGYPMGTKRLNDPNHALQTMLVPGQIKDKNKSMLHKRIQQLGNLSSGGLSHPSTWNIMQVGRSGTYVIPLEPEERYQWAKRYGEYNKKFEEKLKTKKYRLKSEGGKMTASELAFEISSTLRGNKMDALDDFLYEKKDGKYVRPHLKDRWEYFQEKAGESREITNPFITQ